ncbi:MAG: metalloenzyme [Spirochaetia bacterium]|nr:metalloenzyme [Spirochaetia bacterium]
MDIKNLDKNKNGPETIILVFIDGIGFGKKDLVYNPFTKYGKDFFSVLGGKTSFSPPGTIIPINAHMGLTSSLPQSGTGQVALFTGHNTISLMHRHMAGFPPYSLRPYIKNDSIVNFFLKHQLKAGVINTYTRRFLEILEKPRSERFMSASTLMQIGSGQRLLTMEDHFNEKSLFMDITNWFLRKELGYDIPEITPLEAGKRLVKIARDYNLVVYEYFFTDKYGHEGTNHDVAFIVNHIEDLLTGIWEEINPEKELVVVSSDHGNFEDLSTPVHTENQIPAIFYGSGDDKVTINVREIYDVARYLYSLKNIQYKEPSPLIA